MISLQGKVAIVTGGATRIGAALALGLAEAGARVAVLDIDAHNGRAVAEALGERGCFIATDITSDSAIDAAVLATVARFGGIDVLVNLVS